MGGQELTPPRRWRRNPRFSGGRMPRLLVACAVLAYLVLALGSIEIDWGRVALGLERGWRFFSAFSRPDFVSRWPDIALGLEESLTMALTATLAGAVLSVPIGLAAARNLAPWPVYLCARGIIAISRALQEIIVAILFVAMVGFGPLAGFLTLTFASIGFLGKLLAEAVEDIDGAPLEALRATGASGPQILDFAVLPQIMPRFVGILLYRLDINFRESAVVGIVGAGGIGATLNTAMDRYEYDSAAAVLLLVIAIVAACEYLSGVIRRWLR